MDYMKDIEVLHPETIALIEMDFDNLFMADLLSVQKSFIRKRMDPSYVDYFMGHNDRVGALHESLLLLSGFSPNLAMTRRLEAQSHDIGKCHASQLPFWKLTKEKQLREDFEKTQMRKHANLGPAVLDEALHVMGIPHRGTLSNDKQIHLMMCDYVAVNHHNTFNKEQGTLIRSISVSDSIDGQLKTLTDKPLHSLDEGEIQSLRDEAIKKLSTDRYEGQLCPQMLSLAKTANNVSRRPIIQHSLVQTLQS